MSTDNKTRVVTTYRLQEMKSRGEKIAMLTAYDYSMARIVDSAGVDVVLVGDSAANVMAGYETTVPMSLEHMIYHARSVTRAVKRALVVVDMPFGTYQGNSKEALASAVRIMKESEADAIKLEGGEEILESVQRILCAGIPVMGHLGLTPQSIHKYGTYSVRAKEEAEARKLIRDAHLLEAVGCFGIVLEKIPATLGAQVLNNRSVEMAKKYNVELEVLSSLESKPGTIVKETVKMEKTLIRGVAKDTNVATISVIGLKDTPGVAFKIFNKLAQHKINVDIILQSVGRDATKDITFTVPLDDGKTAVSAIEGMKDSLNYKEVTIDESIAKVSVVGAGMESHPGVASKMFEALYDAGINIRMISTSEIKISVLIDAEDADRAVRVVHDAFIF